jgi:SAM-dependent methyltransferase
MSGGNAESKLLKVHLGCGKRYIPGFVHVDLDDFPHIDHRHDLRSLPFLPDDSVDLIYACHVLEYFDRVEVGPVLQEWRRTLKPGGTLRLAAPDFAALAEIYRRHGDLNLIHGPLYGRIAIGRGENAQVLYHKTVYDFPSLKKVLESNSFRNVRRYDWRQTLHRDYDDFSQAYIPHMDKENGRLISLNVEADKAS